MVTAVIFDFDGVLVNSLDMVYEIYGEIATRLNLRKIESLTRFQDLFAGHWHPQLEYMGVDMKNPKMIQAVEDIFKEMHEKLQHTVKLYPGAFDTLAAVKKKNYPIGLVSSNYRKAIITMLETLGIGEFFDIVIANEDAAKVKPHPEPLLVCAKRLGIEPGTAIYIGDSAGDIIAARAASFHKVYATTYGWSRKEQLIPHQPDGFLEKPEDLLRHLG